MSSALQEITAENFDDYLLSINRCIKDIKTIRFVIETFKSFSRERFPTGTTKIKDIQYQLEDNSISIEQEKSYALFCGLIGAEYYIDEKVSKKVPLFPLIRAILPQHVPIFPWQSPEQNDFLLYKKSTENIYIEDLEKTKNHIVRDLEREKLCRFEFDKEFLSIINEMKKFPRSREILSLYQTYLLQKDLTKRPRNTPTKKSDRKKTLTKSKKLKTLIPYSYKDPNEQINLKPNVGHIKHKEISYEGCHSEDEKKRLEKNLNREAEDLFLNYYKAAKKSLDGKNVFLLDESIENVRWQELQAKLKFFGDQLLTLKEIYLPTLLEINNLITSSNNAEREKNKLFSDVKSFFASNDILIDKKFPTARNISCKKPGGPGILKRITAYGGLSIFEKDYKSFLKNNKNPEKAQIPSIPQLNTDGDSTPKAALIKVDYLLEKNEEA